MLRQDVELPRLTVADLCAAIEAGNLKASVDGEEHYRIERRDLLRFATHFMLGIDLEPEPLTFQ